MKHLSINNETHKKLVILKAQHGKDTLSDTIDYLLSIEDTIVPDHSVFVLKRSKDVEKKPDE